MGGAFCGEAGDRADRVVERNRCSKEPSPKRRIRVASSMSPATKVRGAGSAARASPRMVDPARPAQEEPWDALRRAFDVIAEPQTGESGPPMDMMRLLSDACAMMTRHWEKTQGWQSRLAPAPVGSAGRIPSSTCGPTHSRRPRSRAWTRPPMLDRKRQDHLDAGPRGPGDGHPATGRRFRITHHARVLGPPYGRTSRKAGARRRHRQLPCRSGA